MTTGTNTTSITHIALTTNLHLHPLAIASSITLHRSIAPQDFPNLIICSTQRIPIARILPLTKVTIQECQGRHHRQSAHRSRMPKKECIVIKSDILIEEASRSSTKLEGKEGDASALGKEEE
jgi:hypothetical protein